MSNVYNPDMNGLGVGEPLDDWNEGKAIRVFVMEMAAYSAAIDDCTNASDEVVDYILKLISDGFEMADIKKALKNAREAIGLSEETYDARFDVFRGCDRDYTRQAINLALADLWWN